MKSARDIATSILSVASIIFQCEHKQWLRKIPEVELDHVSGMNSRIEAFARVAKAYPEKHSNGVYAVCRAERKIPFTFEPAPQLNANSRQLVDWPLG